MVGSEIVTYTQVRFDVRNFDINKIFIEDIAHGLSYICRYSGQCKSFYSVAEHSLNCLKVAEDFKYDKKIQLYTLYHDATEAYLYDIPTPLKKILPDYKKSEEILENMIYNRVGLENINESDKKLVKDIDNLVFQKEWKELMDPAYFEKYDEREIDGLIFKYRSFEEVENEFLRKSKKLINDIK